MTRLQTAWAGIALTLTGLLLIISAEAFDKPALGIIGGVALIASAICDYRVIRKKVA